MGMHNLLTPGTSSPLLGACKCVAAHRLSNAEAIAWGALGGLIGIVILGLLVQVIVHAAGRRLGWGSPKIFLFALVWAAGGAWISFTKSPKSIQAAAGVGTAWAGSLSSAGGLISGAL